MQQPQRLMASLCSSKAAQEFLKIPARCCGHQDLSGLIELQLMAREGNTECAMALEGLLRQARTLMRHLATPQSLYIFTPAACHASHAKSIIAPWPQATALEVLHTNLNTSLRHLLIDGEKSEHQDLFEMLPLFKSLETLSLNSESCCDPGAVRLPTLHLEGLQQLRSVKLSKVLPSSIQLREDCELHVSTSGRPRLTP